MKGIVRRAAVLGIVLALPWGALSACGSQSFTSGDSDASSDADGGGDANSVDGIALEGAVVDAGPRFCESLALVPFFCADFDNPLDPTEAFEHGLGKGAFTFLVDDGGGLGQADADTAAGRLVLSSSLGFLDPSGGAQARAATGDLGDALDGGILGGHFVLDLDFRIDTFGTNPPTAELDLFSLTLSGDMATTTYRAVIRNGRELDVDIETGSVTTLDFGAAPSNGRWVHARFDITLTGGITATIDGNPQFNASQTTVLQTSPTLSVGLSSGGNSSPATVVFDNLALVVDGPDAG